MVMPRVAIATRLPYRIASLVIAVGVIVGGCGTGTQERFAAQAAFEDTFRVVGEEQVGLNGAENKDRAPISFMILGSIDSEGGVTEAELVQLYVHKFVAEGWDMEPYDVSDNWWTYQGVVRLDGVAALSRVGPASRFHDLATIEEGYARTHFRELAVENPEPLIVVSIDPGI